MASAEEREQTSWSRLAVIGVSVVGFLLSGWWAFFRDSEQDARRQRNSPVESLGHSTFRVEQPSVSSAVKSQLDQLGPESGGWTSEAVTADVAMKLDQIANAMGGSDGAENSMDDGTASTFRGQTIHSESLEIVFESSGVVARSWNGDSDALLPTESVEDQLRSLGFHRTIPTRHKFKVVGIDVGKDEVRSRVLVETVQTGDAAISQRNSELRCRWARDRDGLLLAEVRIDRLTAVELTGEPAPLLQDVTESAFKNIVDRDNHLAQHGLDTSYWSNRLSKIDDANIFGHNGIAVGDVNLDGRPDIYVCDTGGLPNRLYLQAEDGTLIDYSEQSNANWLEDSRSSLLVDLDNDKDLDLVVATVAGILFAENGGDGRFKIRNAVPGIEEAYSMAAADYDNDRDIDIFVAVYGAGNSTSRERGFEASAPIPYDDANNGGANLMLRNEGGFKFQNATAATGIDENNRRFSFAASWEDFDLDGDLDLYVANDFGRNNLYENLGGRFRDVASKLGVEDRAGGMSVAWGDANQDGLADVYIGNMFSAAGSRVTFQRKFLTNRSTSNSASLQRMARGNTLFLGTADRGFVDASESASVWMGRWAWGSRFADLNNDGREDLIVANGYFTNQKKDDL